MRAGAGQREIGRLFRTPEIKSPQIMDGFEEELFYSVTHTNKTILDPAPTHNYCERAITLPKWNCHLFRDGLTGSKWLPTGRR